MKAPVKHVSVGGRVTWTPPDKEWLERQYVVLEKSGSKIALEIGAGTGAHLIYGWLERLVVPQRTPEQVNKLKSWRMLGPNAPNWKESGHSRPRSHARKVLEWEGVPKICSWCGGEKGRITVHHKDHDKYNNMLENLQWLCYYCHELETALWYLLKKDKIGLECKDRTMVIEFK